MSMKKATVTVIHYTLVQSLKLTQFQQVNGLLT